MANSAGKFGPYDRAALPRPASAGAPGAARTGVAPTGAVRTGAVRTRLSARVQTGGELVRSRIALQVRLALLRSGERLPDAGVIADELGLSEITVRRALETMCQDGLLDRRRGRAGGTFVAQDWDAVAAAFRDQERAAPLEDFLLLLECGLVARGAGELPADQGAELSGLVADMERLDDPAELLRLETRFHLGLAEALGDGVAGEQLADLLGQLCLLAPPPEVAQLRVRNACHAELLAALAAGRLDAAVAALKAHQQHL